VVSRLAICACGGIRITCEGEPATVSMCYCQQCQKRTGSAYSVHAYFSITQVKIEGATKGFTRSSDSGRMMNFCFCPECGSTMCWTAPARPDEIGIPLGLFADPSLPPPNKALFVRHRYPWVSIPDGISQYDAGLFNALN
jgi:hypothetical protein